MQQIIVFPSPMRLETSSSLIDRSGSRPFVSASSSDSFAKFCDDWDTALLPLLVRVKEARSVKLMVHATDIALGHRLIMS